MKHFYYGLLILGIWLPLISSVIAEDADPLTSWKSGVLVKPVSHHTNRHVIHSYFNTSPESPDGKYVLYFTSQTTEGEMGNLCLLDRENGEELIIASNIAAEDAHRVACQQWSDGGNYVVYHHYQEDQWYVMAYELYSKQTKTLARGRQVAFGNSMSRWVPIYGCHWNPGEHRDLEMVNVVTGEIKTVLKLSEVVQEHEKWIHETFGTSDVSVFFPIISPNSNRVFFKIARPSHGTDFRSKKASYRAGMFVYDLENREFVRLIEKWGHPSWEPDSEHIFEKGNFSINLKTGKSQRRAPSCFSNHPSVAPNGKLFVTDANVTKRKLGNPGDWAIAVGSMTNDDYVVIDIFGNTKGARSWRSNHPHPAFSADGQRVYYNVNAGQWTTLMVAHANDSNE